MTSFFHFKKNEKKYINTIAKMKKKCIIKCEIYILGGTIKKMNKTIIELRDLHMSYDDEPVVKGINLTVYENEFLTILGPSGCGKTTVLRIIGGFTNPTSGDVIIDGKRFDDIPPYARPTNTVFQRYALFPHLNVLDNIKIGLSNRNHKYLLAFFGEETVNQTIAALFPNKKRSYLTEKKAIKKLVHDASLHALKLVKLEGFENRKISQMSGGQQQRVAIARAIVNRPKILLLDEPLAALDLRLRENMQYELKEMQKALGITFIYVTHDQTEAMTMSDRIVVMNDGIIQQLGTPKDIYNEPVNRFVANFIGESNIVRGKYIGKDFIEVLGTAIACVGYQFPIGSLVDVVIRPEDLDVVSLDKAQIKGVCTSCIFKGVYYEICADVMGIEFVIHAYEELQVGEIVGLKVDPYEIHLMEVHENE